MRHVAIAASALALALALSLPARATPLPSAHTDSGKLDGEALSDQIDAEEAKVQHDLEAVQAWTDRVDGVAAYLVATSSVSDPDLKKLPGGLARLRLRVTVAYHPDYFAPVRDLWFSWPLMEDTQPGLAWSRPTAASLGADRSAIRTPPARIRDGVYEALRGLRKHLYLGFYDRRNRRMAQAPLGPALAWIDEAKGQGQLSQVSTLMMLSAPQDQAVEITLPYSRIRAIKAYKVFLAE